MYTEIRQATITDIPAICEIHTSLKRPSRSEYTATDYLIAVADDRVVGCAGTCIHENGAYLYGLAVLRDWQRQGIGSQLMQARVEMVRNKNFEYAVALAMFWNSRFFRKHGFAPLKRDLLPSSARFHSDLSDSAYRRSSVMFQSFQPGADAR